MVTLWLTLSGAVAHAQAAPGLAAAQPVSAPLAPPNTSAQPTSQPPPPPDASVAPANVAAASEPASASPTPPAADAVSSDADANARALAELRAQNAELRARLDRMDEAQAQRDAAAAGDLAEPSLLAAPELFRVYGFADFGVNHAWIPESSFLSGIVDEDTTFTVGNLNLYFDFRPGEDWRVLMELRFSGYPDGVESAFGTPVGGEYTRVGTEVLDVTSPATASTFHWGTIVIERAYAQWTASDALALRVGQFLTPYGIWNVDHGSPTLIALMLPHFLSAQAFPTRQVGLEALGAFHAGSWKLGYDAYVSNGRTAAQVDYTDDKAIGARIYASRLRPLPLALGASIYYGSIDDVRKDVTSFAPFNVKRTLTVDGTELGVGLDASVDFDGLRVRAEGIMHQTRFEPGRRPPLTSGMPGSLQPDANEYDSYLLLAYQLPIWGLEPFVYGELDHFPSPMGDEQSVLSAGLNVHFTSFAQLKLQVARVLFFDLDDEGAFSENDFSLLFSRLAVAF